MLRSGAVERRGTTQIAARLLRTPEKRGRISVGLVLLADSLAKCDQFPCRFRGVATVEADRAYFTLRASQEILAAETAEHPKARAVHYQIAEHYLALASSIEAHRRRTRGVRYRRRPENI